MTGNPRRPPQFMSSTSLPLLMVVVGVTTAALAPLAGLRAKASVAARNGVLLWGIAALVGANLCFALVPSVQGGRCPRAGGESGTRAARIANAGADSDFAHDAAATGCCPRAWFTWPNPGPWPQPYSPGRHAAGRGAAGPAHGGHPRRERGHAGELHPCCTCPGAGPRVWHDLVPHRHVPGCAGSLEGALHRPHAVEREGRIWTRLLPVRAGYWAGGAGRGPPAAGRQLSRPAGASCRPRLGLLPLAPRIITTSHTLNPSEQARCWVCPTLWPAA